MLLVQEFLRTQNFLRLEHHHGVNASFSNDRRKVSLNYDQIASKENDLLAQQCRGLILARPNGEPFHPTPGDHITGETVVVARPFDRFFNHGQQGANAAALLGQPGTRVFEKLDGTLCIVYFDPHQATWHVATRAVPEADRHIDGFKEHTFRSLFELAIRVQLGKSFDAFTQPLVEEMTYCFELTTPYNRVVVEYPEPGVHLLGLRENQTGEEFCPSAINDPHLPKAPSHSCETFEQLLEIVTSRSPTLSEGVVVRGADFTRVKVKNPAWAALSGLKSSAAASPRRLLETILLGRHDDVFPLLPPDLRAKGEHLRDRLDLASCGINGAFENYRSVAKDLARRQKDGNERKEFALLCQRYKRWMPPFMERYIGRCGDFFDFVQKKKDPATGTWTDSFLDALLEVITSDRVFPADGDR